MLYPLLGDYLAREAAVRSRPKTWAITSGALLVVLSFLLVGYIDTGYSGHFLTTASPKDDPTAEFIDWSPLRDGLRQRGLLHEKDLFVVSSNPVDGGQIDQALNGMMPMQIFGGEGKEYAFRDDPKALIGHDALIIGRREKMIDIGDALKLYFKSIDELAPFGFGRSGNDAINLSILYGHVLKEPLPSPNDKGRE